ncbi:MAG: redoxin domain-containing protein, partial [Alphaproteobacteria bacterium]|nr:redoxin domain-containing protein [Alphaproteobacteria bacterium]
MSDMIIGYRNEKGQKMKRKDSRIWSWIATGATCFIMAVAAASLIQAAQAKEGQLEVLRPALPAPENTVYFDAEGKEQRVADLKGKVVVLHFWAKWCPPCVVELPEFKAFAESMASESVVFLPLSLDKDPDTVAQFFGQN